MKSGRRRLFNSKTLRLAPVIARLDDVVPAWVLVSSRRRLDSHRGTRASGAARQPRARDAQGCGSGSLIRSTRRALIPIIATTEFPGLTLRFVSGQAIALLQFAG